MTISRNSLDCLASGSMDNNSFCSELEKATVAVTTDITKRKMMRCMMPLNKNTYKLIIRNNFAFYSLV